MNIPKALLLTSFLLGSAAHAQSLTLSSALAHSDDQPSVIAARTVAQNAEAEYAKAKIDPLATKVTILKARQAYELAQTNLKTATAQAAAQIAQAYTQVLEAKQGAAVAQQASDLAQKGARVAQIQYEKGGGTQISAQVALNQASAAKQALYAVQDGLNLASSNLRGLVGDFTSLAPVPANAVPNNVGSSVVDQVVGRNAAYVQIQQGIAALQLQLNLADPVAVSASQINALKTQLQQAQSGSQTAQRGLRLQAQALYNSYLQAIKNRSVKQVANQNAQRQYAADQSRYNKGLISQLTLMQSQIAAQQAQLAANQANDAVVTAYYNLLAGGSATGASSSATPAAGQTGSSSK